MFKDFIAHDLNTFINTDEFGELHDIDGRQLLVVLDTEHLAVRTKKEYEGIYVGDILYYVKVADFGDKPKPDSMQTFDNVPYVIFDCREDNGMYEIILKGSGC